MELKKYRRGIFVVVYAREKDKIYYLILKRKLHWKGWEFVKGGNGFLESYRRTVKREVKEETGLTLIKIKRFKEKGKYKYAKELSDRKGIVGQTYKLYSAKVKKVKIKISREEHSDYKWLKFKDAIKKLTYPNQRRCLRIVNEELMK